MKLQLENVLPQPLAANPRPSAIWQQSVTWNACEKLFVRAPSGTGKTTLIHALFGLRNDYSGRILWDNSPASSLSSADWALLRSRKIGIIFQDLRLMPELTAWENLEIKRSLTNTVHVEEVMSWMSRLGIAGKIDSLAKTLSYGEQQRLSIIRALLQPFHWLLMDEPFSHLDEANKVVAASLIDEVVNRNEASFLMADLDDNDYLPYTQKLIL